MIGFENWTISTHPAACPCRGCDKRQLGCHGTCKAYAQFKAEIEEFRKKERTEKEKNAYGRPAPKKRRR